MHGGKTDNMKPMKAMRDEGTNKSQQRKRSRRPSKWALVKKAGKHTPHTGTLLLTQIPKEHRSKGMRRQPNLDPDRLTFESTNSAPEQGSSKRRWHARLNNRDNKCIDPCHDKTQDTRQNKKWMHASSVLFSLRTSCLVGFGSCLLGSFACACSVTSLVFACHLAGGLACDV